MSQTLRLKFKLAAVELRNFYVIRNCNPYEKKKLERKRKQTSPVDWRPMTTQYPACNACWASSTSYSCYKIFIYILSVIRPNISKVSKYKCWRLKWNLILAKLPHVIIILILGGSLYVSGKLPTYPSSTPTSTLTSHLGHNVSLGEGQVGSFPETYNDPPKIS